MKGKCVLIGITSSILALSACSAAREIEYETPESLDRYTNCMEIDGQWGANGGTGADGQYGIGDPFVMRWNGKYYLYPSTSDPCNGIKVFESDDLIHWTYKGYAVAETEETSHGAYAPEVVYYNGYFYLCQSRGGNGHYIYRSESPTEGFTLISKSDTGEEGSLDYGNLGMGIDGSFYVSDDGKLYLLHTSTPAGLKYNEITDIGDIRPSTIGEPGTLGNANLQHWIEGPGIFRRGAYSYLTYTGNHVLSQGYRVAYSYAEDLTDLSSFIQPTDNVTIMDTDADHYGLGHSSNVNGPDLDSIYTAYHSLVGRGPARRYNVDRYFASGGILTANGVTHRAVAAPSAPTAKASDASELTKGNEGYVLGTSEAYFTAEYNFTPSAGQELFFGLANGSGYLIRLTEGKIALYRISGKSETLVKEQSAVYAADKLNTVRVENGDGVGYVYLNGMRLIAYDAEAAAGEIGYRLADGVQYTAFTNDVFGTSDFEAIKNFPTKFPATAYLKGENRGFSIAGAKQVAGGVRVGEKEKITRYGDEYAVSLKKNDWVKYAVDVPSDGMYSVSALVSRSGAGAKLKITVGDNELTCTIPETGSGESETVKVSLGRIAAQSGIAAMKVQVLSGSADFVTFEVYEDAESEEVSLADYTAKAGTVSYENGTLTVIGGDEPSVALWGNAGIADFEAEISFRCNAGTGTNFGIMIRASHYSYYSAQPTQSWRGYYLKLGSQLMQLDRYDYGSNFLQAARIGTIGDGGDHTLKIRAQSRTITVVLDGTYTLTAEDDCAFLSGQLGIYASSGQIQITQFKYSIL